MIHLRSFHHVKVKFLNDKKVIEALVLERNYYSRLSITRSLYGIAIGNTGIIYPIHLGQERIVLIVEELPPIPSAYMTYSMSICDHYRWYRLRDMVSSTEGVSEDHRGYPPGKNNYTDINIIYRFLHWGRKRVGDEIVPYETLAKETERIWY